MIRDLHLIFYVKAHRIVLIYLNDLFSLSHILHVGSLHMIETHNFSFLGGE